jgi:hypothetical protein
MWFYRGERENFRIFLDIMKVLTPDLQICTEDGCRLGCCAVYSGKNVAGVSKVLAATIVVVMRPFLPHYTAQHSGRWPSLESSPWEFEISPDSNRVTAENINHWRCSSSHVTSNFGLGWPLCCCTLWSGCCWKCLNFNSTGPRFGSETSCRIALLGVPVMFVSCCNWRRR